MSEPKSNTEIIQNPPASVAVEEYVQRVNDLLDFSRSRQILNNEDATGAVDDLSIIAITTKDLEDRRKEYTGPLRARTDEINAVFKTVSDPLAQADKITRAKLQTYRDEQRRRHDDEEKLNRDKLALAQREMELKGELSPDTNVQPVPVTPAPPKKMEAHMGSAGTRKDWTYEILDFKALPDEYKLADDKKLMAAARAKIAVPGVKAWQVESTRITPKRK
jgi:hypothetical protein